MNKIFEYFKNKPLVFKLNVSILISILLGSILLCIFVSNYSKPILKEQVISAAYKSLGEINYGIARGADMGEQSIVNTENYLELKSGATENELLELSKAALEAINEQYGYFYEFFIFIPSKDGKHNGILYHSCLKNGKISTVPWKEREFIRSREWLNEALKTGNIEWSEPYFSIDPNDNAILSTTVAKPFKFKNSKNWDGVIAASGNLDELKKGIIKTDFESDGRFLMISKSGMYLVHPNPEIELKKNIYDMVKKMKSSKLDFVMEQLAQGKSGFLDLSETTVFDENDVVFVYMPIPKTGWSSFLVFDSNNFYKPIKHFQIIFILVMMVSLFVLMLLINKICKFTTKPIVELSKVADKYGKGEFSIELPEVKTLDEVGILTQAFYNMKDNLLKLIDIQKENAQKEQKRASELEIATRIQASALPKDFPQNNHFNINAIMNPATEIGGDFYDFFYTDENHFVFLVADVSGKGIPAALFMMNAKSLLKNNIQNEEHIDIAISKTNNELCNVSNSEMFVTAFIAKLNLETGEIEYVNAGHNPPLVRINGIYKYLDSETNIVLSAVEDFEYKSDKLKLGNKDGIFIYTDGVVEAQNQTEELYSEERLHKFLNENELTPEELLPQLKKNIDEFTGGQTQYDDITMLNLIYKK